MGLFLGLDDAHGEVVRRRYEHRFAPLAFNDTATINDQRVFQDIASRTERDLSTASAGVDDRLKQRSVVAPRHVVDNTVAVRIRSSDAFLGNADANRGRPTRFCCEYVPCHPAQGDNDSETCCRSFLHRAEDFRFRSLGALFKQLVFDSDFRVRKAEVEFLARGIGELGQREFEIGGFGQGLSG